MRGEGERDVRAEGDAVRRWTERARAAWLVGESAVAMLDLMESGESGTAGPQVVVARLEEVLRRGGFGPGVAVERDGGTPSQASAPSDGRAQGRPRTGKAQAAVLTPWRDGQRVLDGERYVVLFLGGVAVRSAWATVAVGVLGDGRKQVLGLWRGSTLETAVVRSATENLASRGLTAGDGLLIVADGSTALDAAVQRVWGAWALIAHCERSVAAEVLEHLAEKDRPPVRQTLRAAWAESGAECARRLFAVVRLMTRCPGAAARLRRSLGALGTVGALELPGRLAEHLRGIGPIRELAEAAREAGGTGAPGIAAVLPERLSRMRRLIGAEALPVLTERLAARVACTEAALTHERSGEAADGPQRRPRDQCPWLQSSPAAPYRSRRGSPRSGFCGAAAPSGLPDQAPRAPTLAYSTRSGGCDGLGRPTAGYDASCRVSASGPATGIRAEPPGGTVPAAARSARTPAGGRHPHRRRNSRLVERCQPKTTLVRNQGDVQNVVVDRGDSDRTLAIRIPGLPHGSFGRHSPRRRGCGGHLALHRPRRASALTAASRGWTPGAPSPGLGQPYLPQ